MDQQSTGNKFPILFAIISVLALTAAAAYFFLGRNASKHGEEAAYASAEAQKAISVAGINEKQRAATEAIVRAYILENPEVIAEAIEILQKREVTKRINAAGSALTRPFPGAVTGNPDGTITLVEFTDYNCGFCRAAVADLDRLVASNKDVRIVFREVPILSPSSEDAARWALAAAKQGKYKAFHDAMFAAGPVNDQSIRAAARRAGVNLAQAEKDAASAQVKAELEANLAMKEQIGFGGTPTFFVKNQMIEGAVGYEALKAAVEKARQKG